MNNYQSLIDILIKDEMQGIRRHERILILGEQTPGYLVEKAGFPRLPLAIKASVIAKAVFDHGITASTLKRLPGIIEAPKSLFKSASHANDESVVILTFEVKGNAPIVIPIRKEQMVGRTEIYNLVTSVYGKEGPDPERKWKSSGLLIYEW